MGSSAGAMASMRRGAEKALGRDRGKKWPWRRDTIWGPKKEDKQSATAQNGEEDWMQNNHRVEKPGAS